MLKIVITGSSGLLGREMVNLLKKKNINFISLSSRIISLKIDLLKIKEFNPDILFHFGALKKNKFGSGDFKKELIKSNVTLTNELSRYCHKKNIKFVYISTADLYKRYGEPCDEIALISQSKSTITGGLYGWTKYLGEGSLINQNGNFLIFRSSTIYDKNIPYDFSCAKLFNHKDDLRKFEFNEKQYQMNFVRSDFLAKAILKISQKEKTISKIYNYTASFWINNFDIYNLYAKKYSLLTLKKKEKEFLEKRFNASNALIKKELGIEFEESNYLQDLSFYLASKEIGAN